MEARLTRVILLLAVCAASAHAGGYYSRNFVVTAPTTEFAQEVCQAAEHYRQMLAMDWLGHELPPWQDRCPIVVRVGPHLGAGGVTSFGFDQGRPHDWRMRIEGSRERILDSVLPHEVAHTIFATHFGQPLPRWADEGACTTVEHESEKGKHYQHLYRYLTTSRGIPFSQMFRMTEYPQDIMPLYAQGHSVVEYLVAQGGRRRFVDFLADGLTHQNWDQAVRVWYGFGDLSDLQIRWVDWLRNGRPPLQQGSTLLAAAPAPEATAAPPNAAPASTATLAAVPAQNSNVEHTEPASATLVASAAKPAPTNAVMATGSWYSRQRDQAQLTLSRSAELPGPFTPGSTVPVGSPVIYDGNAEPSHYAVSAVDWENEGKWTSQTYRR